MDVEDAFTAEMIDAAGTNISDEVESEVRELIAQIYRTNEISPLPSDDDLKVAMLCFVAGRTYQSDLAEDRLIEIPMTADEVHEYISYLAHKGSP